MQSEAAKAAPLIWVLCVTPMKRKPPPYKVVFGKISARPPIYVKYLEHSPIQLNGAAEEFERLKLNPKIPYDDTGPVRRTKN